MKQWVEEIATLTLMFLFLFLLFVALPVNAADKEPIFVTYQQANCNVITYLLMNIEAEEVAKENFNQLITDETANKLIEQVNQRQAEREKFKQDVSLLAHLIWNEVGVLGEYAMYCCGSVVLNRIKSDIYPNTLRDVIYQSGQYEITWNGMINREIPDSAYKIAENLLLNGSILPENVVFQAEFVQGKGVYKQIGNTYFCYL